MSVRVINLGLPKTGTTTLARALRRAGLKTADHRIRPHQSEDPHMQKAFVADLLYKGYFETQDPLALFDGFGALTEISLLRQGRSLWPQTDLALLRAIRLHHPQVKFVASNRDTFALSQSMLAWSDLGTDRLPRAHVPGLPEGYGETTKQRMQWIEGHYDTLRHVFHGDPQFLEYDVADPDAPERLGAFLGVSLPWWGQSNTSPVTQKA